MASKCKVYTMNKAELEHYLHQRWGDKIGPLKPRIEGITKLKDLYEQKAGKTNCCDRRPVAGGIRIRKIGGTIHQEYAWEGEL